MSSYRVCLLPGDGIGPEVIDCAEQVLTALPIQWDFTRADIGFGSYEKHGTPLPETSLDAIGAADAALFGAVTTPVSVPGYFSPVVRMRQGLDLYANLRPSRSIPHASSRPGVDLLIVRENTEGLYSGIERIEEDGRRAVTERIITRGASERILRKAFELAGARPRKMLHVIHKANVLRATCGLFRQVALDLAPDYPDVELREMLVDTCAMELVRAPEQFDVIVTTNLFGDILSDEACMFVGGLGVAASANLGAHAAVFEPVHGSAPDLAGTGAANPIATLMAAALMLDHLGEPSCADALRGAIEACIGSGRVTADLGGTLTSTEATRAVIRQMRNVRSTDDKGMKGSRNG